MQAGVRAKAALWAGLACAFSATAEGRGHQGLTSVDTKGVEEALRPPPGRLLLVHLWASWCRPCVSEWPSLAEWLRHPRDRRLDVVTLAIDEADTRPAAEAVLGRLGRLPGRVLAASLDDCYPALRALDPEWDGSLPTTILVGADGHLLLAEHGLTRLDALEKALGAAAKDPIRASDPKRSGSERGDP